MQREVTIITGASSGIGRALSVAYASDRQHLILAALGLDALEEAAAECRKNGSTSACYELDLSDTKSIEQFTNSIKTDYTNIDRLIHISGISQRAKAEDTSLDVDRRIMEINYFGAVTLTKAFLPLLKAGNGAHIGVTSSISGKFGFPLRSAYAASKFALHGFFESLRLEHYQHNISVTIMCPGRINTPISLSALEADGKPHGKMDSGQYAGMPVQKCAKKMKTAIENRKKEVFIGGKEILMVYFKKYLPFLFYRIAKNINPT